MLRIAGNVANPSDGALLALNRAPQSAPATVLELADLTPMMNHPSPKSHRQPPWGGPDQRGLPLWMVIVVAIGVLFLGVG